MDYNGCFYRSRRLPLRELFFLRPGPGMPGPYAMRVGYIHPNSISMDFPEYIFLFPDMQLHPG